MTDLASIATAPLSGDLDLVPLPDSVVDVLVAVGARPRLAAHLRLVHDTAAVLASDVRDRWPHLQFDEHAVLSGAATHDIGKALHPEELTGTGSRHEDDGGPLLLDHGFAPDIARFARTHAAWSDDDATIEDRLVALADKVWKGRREEDLEALVVADIATASGEEGWQVFADLDAILERIACDADRRLAWQSQHSAGERR